MCFRCWRLSSLNGPAGELARVPSFGPFSFGIAFRPRRCTGDGDGRTVIRARSGTLELLHRVLNEAIDVRDVSVTAYHIEPVTAVVDQSDHADALSLNIKCERVHMGATVPFHLSFRSGLDAQLLMQSCARIAVSVRDEGKSASL
jgi:hypothetical protein